MPKSIFVDWQVGPNFVTIFHKFYFLLITESKSSYIVILRLIGSKMAGS